MDQEIYLAVLERMFSRWESYGPRLGLPVRYYIELQGSDAPPDLLAALRSHGYSVFPGSDYRHGSGVRLSLDEIQRQGRLDATVYGGYLFGSVGGEWGPFVLALKDGKWEVTSWVVDLAS